MIVPTVIKEWLKKHPTFLVELEYVGPDLLLSYWTPDHKTQFGVVKLSVDDQQRLMDFAVAKVFSKP